MAQHLPSSTSAALELLCEARRRLPGLRAALGGLEHGPCVTDAVAATLLDWVREADAADFDIVFRLLGLLGLWDDVLARDDADPEVVRTTVLALWLLRVTDQPWGPETFERASPSLLQTLRKAPGTTLRAAGLHL